MRTGICWSCKHGHFSSGFYPYEDDFTCDMWDTDKWKIWEEKIGKKMSLVGGFIECPLWEDRDSGVRQDLSFCEKHLIWYGVEYGCPRCKAEEIIKETGGVIL